MILRSVIQDDYAWGLDIGHQTIKAAVVRKKDRAVTELLGVFESRTRGFQAGSVTDLTELSAGIDQVLQALMQKTGHKCKAVHLGIGGSLLESRISSSVIPLTEQGNKVITQRDIDKVESQARLLGVNLDEAVLHDFPQRYRVDDAGTAHNPIGLYARKLEVETLLVVASNTLLKNLNKAVNEAGFDICGVSLGTFAAAEAMLEPEEKRAGCLFLDIGSGTLNLIAYQGGLVQDFGLITCGSGQLTLSLAETLGMPLEMAEEIKKTYAFASHSETAVEEDILIKKDEGFIPVKKASIYEAIESPVNELLKQLHQRMTEKRLLPFMNSIVLSGGGCLLSGLAERIEEQVRIPVRIGKVRFVDKKMPQLPKYAACIGLAGASLRELPELHPQHSGGGTSWARRVAGRIKELYEEYF